MANRQGRSHRVPRPGRWLAIAIAILIPLGPTGPARSNAAATSPPPGPPTTWEGDTSAVRLPLQFRGENFFVVWGEVARTQRTKGRPGSTEERPARMTWHAFRLEEHLSLDYGPDSQVVSCRIDLKQAQTGEPGFAGAKVMTLHTEIERGKTYSANDARGFTLQIHTGTREGQGLLLVTSEGDVARSLATFDRTFSLDRIQGAAVRSPLRVYAVCRVTPRKAGQRALVDQESYTEPSAGLPVRLHNRLQYLCVHVASIWFVDSATGAIVHKEPFDPQN